MFSHSAQASHNYLKSSMELTTCHLFFKLQYGVLFTRKKGCFRIKRNVAFISLWRKSCEEKRLRSARVNIKRHTSLANYLIKSWLSATCKYYRFGRTFVIFTTYNAFFTIDPLSLRNILKLSLVFGLLAVAYAPYVIHGCHMLTEIHNVLLNCDYWNNRYPL